MYVWYKNGEDITQDMTFNSDDIGWTYSPDISQAGAAFVGIYQCFIQNAVGSDFSLTRVLEIGMFF